MYIWSLVFEPDFGEKIRRLGEDRPQAPFILLSRGISAAHFCYHYSRERKKKWGRNMTEEISFAQRRSENKAFVVRQSTAVCTTEQTLITGYVKVNPTERMSLHLPTRDCRLSNIISTPEFQSPTPLQKRLTLITKVKILRRELNIQAPFQKRLWRPNATVLRSTDSYCGIKKSLT